MGNNTHDRDRMVIANRQAWNDSAWRHKAGERWEQLLQDVPKPGFSCFDQTMRMRCAGLTCVENLWCKSVATTGARCCRFLLSG